ncbi:flagellar basal body rod protein FlgB [Xylophilus sp. Kf1]|nr:flagellar basal body rod protein FlgB [Xylophilus sp. Kf1]
MLERLTSQLDFHSKALVLRAERQRVIASNIANADTPGYAARDLDFASALRNATGGGSSIGGGSGSGSGGAALQLASAQGSSIGGAYRGGDLGRSGFMPIPGALEGSGGGDGKLGYSIQSQPSMDGNSVDLDRERAAFADNSVHYEATLRFINGQAKTLLTAIQGQ